METNEKIKKATDSVFEDFVRDTAKRILEDGFSIENSSTERTQFFEITRASINFKNRDSVSLTFWQRRAE